MVKFSLRVSQKGNVGIGEIVLHGGRRKGAGRKPTPPRIVRNNLVINLQWLEDNHLSTLREALRIAQKGVSE